MLDRVDGLMLAGGADIDPAAYGAEPHPPTIGCVPERDAFEIALVRRALERDLPVLGICRGMQIMNVACGGTLHQHLPELLGHEEHRRVLGSFDGADHDVRLAPGSLAARAAGEELHATKSHHHQGVDRVGDGLVVTGWAVLDDLPEAIELPGNRFALGVQWHPEADETSRLIAALVEHAGRARALRPSPRTKAFPRSGADLYSPCSPHGHQWIRRSSPPRSTHPTRRGTGRSRRAMPRVQVTRRGLVLVLFFVVSAVAFLYFVLPQLADLEDTGERVGEGNRWWLAAAFVFSLPSFGGYVMMFQGVFVRGAGSRIDWRASYQITMAGLAATRLFAAGGAGGIALTAWALRRAGMPRRKVADKTLAFLILTYAVYMAALVVCGFGLYFGLLPGSGAVRDHGRARRCSASS